MAESIPGSPHPNPLPEGEGRSCTGYFARPLRLRTEVDVAAGQRRANRAAPASLTLVRVTWISFSLRSFESESIEASVIRVRPRSRNSNCTAGESRKSRVAGFGLVEVQPLQSTHAAERRQRHAEPGRVKIDSLENREPLELYDPGIADQGVAPVQIARLAS